MSEHSRTPRAVAGVKALLKAGWTSSTELKGEFALYVKFRPSAHAFSRRSMFWPNHLNHCVERPGAPCCETGTRQPTRVSCDISGAAERLPSHQYSPGIRLANLRLGTLIAGVRRMPPRAGKRKHVHITLRRR